ncbi:MAG: S8 family serine peptidase [Actinobacteria bacterium]|nr:S8 family serine peptidase [Actinomycetota bacterium]
MRSFRVRSAATVLALLLLAGLLTPSAALGESGSGKNRASAAGSSNRIEPDVPTADVAPVPLGFRESGNNLIRLSAGAFDPLQKLAPVAIPALDATALSPNAPTYWLVQVKEGEASAAVTSIDQAGGKVDGYVPDSAYLVRATPLEAASIATASSVRWVGLFQPGWKFAPQTGDTPGLLDLEGSQTYKVYLFQSQPNPGSIRNEIDSISGVDVKPESSSHVLLVKGSAAQVPAIAGVGGVEWIGVKAEAVPLNADARWVTDTGVRDVFSATAPSRLTGAGQTAAVADTGINYIPDPNQKAQAYFRDCAFGSTNCKLADFTQTVPGISDDQMNEVQDNNTNHRKMAAYFDLGGAGAVPPDAGAHGTHVSGSVNGDFAGNGTWQRSDGMAPASRLVFQSIATPAGTLGGLPADQYDLFRQAYRPSDPASVGVYDAGAYANYTPLEDARTHNNSYGLTVPVLDLGDAVRTDDFVWEHEDMAIVTSAGNAGPGAASIGSPAIAKNVFASAASANGRQPMVSIDSLAIFSSHGPTADGRFGVTVATPGQIVVSAKGGGAAEQHTLQGTSMSGPVLTGLLTLVREYFYNGWGPAEGKGFGVGSPSPSRRTNPSAALVRAVVTNGANRMRGYYTGADGTVPETNGQWPSAGQGFGLVNLDNSLFFPGDDLNNWYHDVYRADEEAFAFPGGLETRSYTIDVGDGQPLDVSMSYTDAPNALPAGSPATVNNLDLTVIAPDGTEYAGNNFNTEVDPTADVAETLPTPVYDANNTTERVRLPEPAAGEYTIEVSADALFDGPQGFALAASGALSGAGAPALGAGLQPDASGSPTISNIEVDQVTGDTAWVRWDTSEPTTGKVTFGSGGSALEFIDSYNVGPDGFNGLNAGEVETSADYANKPMLTRKHEVLLTGLTPGADYIATISATDQAENAATKAVPPFTTTPNSFGADSPDIAQLAETNDYGGFGVGTQLYIGKGIPAADNEDLGAFMFRLPESVDPSMITGAAIQLTSHHDITNTYTDDARYVVDLLPEAVEADWQSNTFQEIREPAAEARLSPLMADRLGGGMPYTFSFECGALDALKATLETATDGERNAAFRALGLSDQGESLMSYETGFNRRSRGPQYRPRLLLFTKDADGNQIDAMPCDPNTAAPTISGVTVAPAAGPAAEVADETGYVVTWQTNSPSDSAVMFKEMDSSSWTQVSSPVKTTHHMVRVKNLDPNTDYEFIVRSTTCNGKSDTDTNGGEGFAFAKPSGDPGGEDPISPTYTFDESEEGWTTQSDTALPGPFNSEWTRSEPGHDSPMAFHIPTYGDNQDESLISPDLTTTGGTVAVDFSVQLNQETEFDPLSVDYSTDGGTTWLPVTAYPGEDSAEWQEKRATFSAPAGSLKIRFRFVSDEIFSSPLHEGVAVDTVTVLETSSGGTPDASRLSEGATPTSAGDSGLEAPAPHDSPTAADLAHGTASCAPTGGGTGGLKRPKVKLKVSDRTPVRGTMIRLKASLAACATDGAALGGTNIRLLKKKKGKWHRVATKSLNDNCKVKFKKKAKFKKASFRAVWPKQAADYRRGRSQPIKIKTHRRK